MAAMGSRLLTVCGPHQNYLVTWAYEERLDPTPDPRALHLYVISG